MPRGSIRLSCGLASWRASCSSGPVLRRWTTSRHDSWRLLTTLTPPWRSPSSGHMAINRWQSNGGTYLSRAVLGVVPTVLLPLLNVLAPADAKEQAAAGELIHRRHRFSQEKRGVLDHQATPAANLDCLSDGGHGRWRPSQSMQLPQAARHRVLDRRGRAQIGREVARIDTL